MKNLLLFLILAIGGGVFWRLKIYQPPAVKAYREYRKEVIQNSGQTGPYYIPMPDVRFHRQRVYIDKKEIGPDSAVIEATDVSWWMPPEAAAVNFATVVEQKLRAELAVQDGAWVVVSEEVLDEKISERQDRKLLR